MVLARTGSQKTESREKFRHLYALSLSSLSLFSLSQENSCSFHRKHSFFPSAKSLHTLGSTFGTACQVGCSLWLRTYERKHSGGPFPWQNTESNSPSCKPHVSIWPLVSSPWERLTIVETSGIPLTYKQNNNKQLFQGTVIDFLKIRIIFKKHTIWTDYKACSNHSVYLI